MGTTISVTARDDDAVAATRRWFAHAERACSRFLADSPLTRLNDDPRRAVPVPAELAEVLAVASRLRDRTGGLVDAGVGADVVRWGYDQSFEAVADRREPPRGDAGGRSWSLRDGRLIRSPGLRLDLGGIAKGWAADRAVARGWASIVSAGGDIASAHEACVVDVTGPGGEVVATIPLGVGALATSSVGRRTWRVAGEAVHHIIDPRTGAPAQTPVESATVIARSAVEAEAGAKTVLLRGAGGLAWAAAQSWIDGALVVWHDGAVYATSGFEVAAA